MYQVQKKKKGFLFYIFLFACAFSVGLGIGYASIRHRTEEKKSEIKTDIPQIKSEEKEEPGQVVSASLPEVTQAPEETGYFVIEQDGRVCVFTTDSAGTRRFSHTLSIQLEALKEEDKKLFQEGIVLQTKEELLSLVEDFSS